MSIARINRFRAQEGKERELRQLIESFLPEIETAGGCRGCRLLQHQEDPSQLVVVEFWESPQDHQAAAGRVSPETLKKAMALLAAPPEGEYYDA